jgi:hypothetical protein
MNIPLSRQPLFPQKFHSRLFHCVNHYRYTVLSLCSSFFSFLGLAVEHIYCPLSSLFFLLPFFFSLCFFSLLFIFFFSFPLLNHIHNNITFLFVFFFLTPSRYQHHVIHCFLLPFLLFKLVVP